MLSYSYKKTTTSEAVLAVMPPPIGVCARRCPSGMLIGIVCCSDKAHRVRIHKGHLWLVQQPLPRKKESEQWHRRQRSLSAKHARRSWRYKRVPLLVRPCSLAPGKCWGGEARRRGGVQKSNENNIISKFDTQIPKTHSQHHHQEGRAAPTQRTRRQTFLVFTFCFCKSKKVF